MFLLHIEHPIFDYAEWKKAFDSDPAGRAQSGVRRYRIMQPTDDEKYIMIDLEFDTRDQAEALLAAMRVVWGRVEGSIMTNAQTRIAAILEAAEY